MSRGRHAVSELFFKNHSNSYIENRFVGAGLKEEDQSQAIEATQTRNDDGSDQGLRG